MSKNKKKSDETLDRNDQNDQNNQDVDSTQDATQEETTEDSKVETESPVSNVPAPGNPYTVSADGGGRPYDPAVDGAPGKEAEDKQAESDKPNA